MANIMTYILIKAQAVQILNVFDLVEYILDVF